MHYKTRAFHWLSVVLVGIGVILNFGGVSTIKGESRGSARDFTLKIVELTSSPSPFELGKSELKLSVVVELPRKLNGANLLELTALISSPTQSSMRFLFQRLPLTLQPKPQENPHVHTALFWDGKDQNKNLVSPGTYRYEVRAKLMLEGGDGPRTKIVSERSHGTVEVINSQADP